MGKRKSLNKTPTSNSKDNILTNSPGPKSPNKMEKSKIFETPKQVKSVPNVQSEGKQDIKKFNKRKSLPANLVNGGSNDVPTKKAKTEPFAGTTNLLMQVTEKSPKTENKSVFEINLNETPNTDESKSIKLNSEPLTERARRKKEKVKKIRLAAKGRFKQTISEVTSGDEAAIGRIQSKIAELTKKENLSYSGKRKLRKLKRILTKSNIQIDAPNVKKENQTSVQQQQKKNIAKPKKNIVQNIKQEPQHIETLVKAEQDETDDDEEEEEEEEITDESGLIDDKEVSEEEESGSEDENDEEMEDESDEEIEDENEKDGEDNESGDNGSEGSDDEAPVSQAPVKSKKQPIDKSPAGAKGQSRYVVFVGNLPYDITRQEIAEHFAKIDAVKHIRIPLDQTTNKCRGFAYVETTDQTSYEKALTLHHTSIKGRRINVLYTQGGKKKGEEKKKEIKAKNFKLKSMREGGKLAGSVKNEQKRSIRRTKQRNAVKKE